MAATGLLAAVLWFSGGGILLAAGVGTGTLGFFFSVGLLFLPLVILTSFILGFVLWGKYYPEENRRVYGSLYGGFTALSSLCVGALAPALLLAVSNVTSGDMAVGEGLVFFVLLLPAGSLFAVIAAGWLVVPLGMFGGWYHERAKGVP
ncbi:hypothetical protein U4E84_05575 [Halorubrum sp. AD140]|uniref:hypothetical protein n=1 Tax=Halorubrum sp. AD140 TaxID=3050073 RepID=UPI002ACD13B4|nr:hypothetical protein [Halorubrum sp. AD140]MDZ5810814.1 hypothetical protein [Halorubrum sp. AD140]